METKILIENMKEMNGFNWMCQGNGHDITKEEYRKLFMELLYTVEVTVPLDYKDIMDEFLDNLPDYFLSDEE